MSTLRYLSVADVDASLPTIAEQLVIAEQALIALVGDAAEVPPKIGVHPRPGAVVHAMPAFGKGADVVGMKMISTYPANPSRQLPPNDALILLDDPETGVAHTLMDGRRITALRTAAISGVAMRHFRPASVERIVLIGAGNQGHTHAAIVEELFPGVSLHIVDRHAQRAVDLAGSIHERGRLGSVTAGREWHAPVAKADIVVTGAALGSASQILGPAALRPGALVVAFDHDTFASAELARAAALFAVDDTVRFDVYLAEGAFAGFPEPNTSVGASLARRNARARPDDGIVLVTPLGFGLTDILFADAVRRNAEAAGLGQLLER